jgi:hypothetical protein
MSKFYYDYDKVLGYGATFNFLVTSRGLGKTYGAIKLCVKDFLKNGNEFIYLRRYKTEISSAAKRLFDAININKEFPGYNLLSEGNKFFIQKIQKDEEDEKPEKILIGHAVALSTANILKSTNFAKVRTIIYDEFLLGPGVFHYLPNEVEAFLDFYETTARMRDVRVFFLGNAITQSNPYFNYFKLTLPYNSDFKTFKNGLIVVNYATNANYTNAKKATKFGQLISDTHYSDYAIDNDWLSDDEAFIEKKVGYCKNVSVVKLNNKMYGIWRSTENRRYYISDDYDPHNICIMSFDKADHDEETILASARSNPFFKFVIDNFRIGNVRFENINVKNEFLNIINKAL